MTGATSPAPERDPGAGRRYSLPLLIAEEDLRRLHALAALDGVDVADADGFSLVAARALRTGSLAHLEAAGLPSDPTSDDVETALALLRATADRASDEVPTATAARRGRRVRWLLVAGVAATALAATIVGSYVGGWTWTGFRTNEQVWNWLQLLLLPVAFGSLPLWLQYSERVSPRRKSALAGAVVAVGLFVLFGYLVPLVWTGFRGQTLWNWLTLIVLPVTITTVRAWPTVTRPVTRVHLVGLVSFLVGWVVTLVGGYALGWRWTGYAGNTLWDWLELLLAPIAINAIVVPTLLDRVSGSMQGQVDAERREVARQRLLEAAEQRANVIAVGRVRRGGDR